MAGPLTRYYVEKVTVGRCKGLLTQAKLSTALDPDTPNEDLSDPLATALEELGVLPADRSNVTDTDLLAISPSLQARFLDLVELRALETALQQIVAAAQSVQWEDYRKSSGMSPAAAQALLAMKWQRYQDRWSQSGVLAVGAMMPNNVRPIDTSGYYPSVG